MECERDFLTLAIGTVSMISFVKDPSALLDYEFNWSSWLGSDTIISYTVTASSGLTVVSSSASSTAVTVWLSGGTEGTAYLVTCQITTAGGRIDERSFWVSIENR